VQAPSLNTKCLNPELRELPVAVVTAAVILRQTKFDFVADESANSRIDLALPGIGCRFLVPRHREVGDVAVEAGADIHFRHCHEKKPFVKHELEITPA